VRHFWPWLALGLVACAEQQAPPAEPESDPRPPAESAGVTPVATTPKPTPPVVAQPRDAGVPPLSTPNAIAPVQTSSAAHEDAGGNEDPRTRALRRIAENAQTCHARHTAGVAGTLVLRISRASDGKVRSATLDRDATSKALLVDALERCVIEGAKRETLPAPSSEDDSEMQIPLTFTP
jgi:hypothetical protein